ncbi:hypothetical protein HZS_1808, partial [Henneguya salminicola]
VDNTGDEFLLGSYFSNNIEKLSFSHEKLEYHYFDFHKNCSGMRFDKVNVLLDTIENARCKMGYLQISRENTSDCLKNANNRQDGVFRTNCIDCLDRTNVVQSMLAWRTLSSIFNDIGMDIETISHTIYFKQIEQAYKNLWADNADYLSIQYSGTCALKTDFTRYGVRTFKGLLNDFIYSVKRYFYSNFCDGYRQDSLDLISGSYNFNSSLSEAYPKEGKSILWGILPVLFISLILFLFGDIFMLT